MQSKAICNGTLTRRLRQLPFAARWGSISLPPRGPEVAQWTFTMALDWAFCPKHWPTSGRVATQITRHHSMRFFCGDTSRTSYSYHFFLATLRNGRNTSWLPRQPSTVICYKGSAMNWTTGLTCAVWHEGRILNICKIKNKLWEFLYKLVQTT
jgi:hypothetical protein